VRHWTNAAFLVRSLDGCFLRAGDAGLEGDGFLVWDDVAGGAVLAEDGLAAAPLEGCFEVIGPQGPIACRTGFDHHVAAAQPYDPATVERIFGVALVSRSLRMTSTIRRSGRTDPPRHAARPQPARRHRGAESSSDQGRDRQQRLAIMAGRRALGWSIVGFGEAIMRIAVADRARELVQDLAAAM
jgi:hypothetical protein